MELPIHSGAPAAPISGDAAAQRGCSTAGNPLPRRALTEIARLANALCEHLTDDQWRLSARIRQLAESSLPHGGTR
ncbi:hypothetical protein AB0I84_08885 [Streptomyces spectabilis]|uniref:hypothetical protein n=1 Tax=Streptomyces spectabilis TaxID=68270 RepID=UPI0034021F97